MPVTNDSGLTFGANLSNPVPSGTLLQPVGSSLGLSTNLGGSPGTVFSTERSNPTFYRYSIGIERELPGQIVVELSYLGQTGSDLPLVESINYVPQEFRTQSPIRDNAAETFLTQTVANPFQGLFPDNPGASGSTIARRRLLLAYPHFDGLNIETYRGTNRYHGAAGALRQALHRRPDDHVHLHVVAVPREGGAAEPVGGPRGSRRPRRSPAPRHARDRRRAAVRPGPRHRQRLGRRHQRLPRRLAVERQVRVADRPAAHLGQRLLRRRLRRPVGPDEPLGHRRNGQKLGIDVPFFDTSCFYTRDGQPFVNAAGQPSTFGAPEISLGAANIRRFPSTLPNVRFQNHHLLDLGLTKSFQLGGRVRLQVRVEALNATNYTLFNAGNVILAPTNAAFGKITNIDSSTVMKPRDYQLGLRLTF